MNRRNFLRIGVIGVSGLILHSALPAVKVVEAEKPFVPEYGVYYITCNFTWNMASKVEEKVYRAPVINIRPRSTKVIPIHRHKFVRFHRRTYSRAS